ncbi:response regulator [Chromatiaceae bacterium AAb-1]|nr:response regulator [Chromatiaceae bacterium AAb-1]
MKNFPDKKVRHGLLTALIIDDTAAVRRYIKYLLRQMGVEQVMEAADGISGSRLFEQHHPGLIFLDIQLPDINGKQLLRQFRQQRNDAAIFIVSAFSSIENLQQAVEYGATAFVVKPFTATRIYTLVKPLIY